jgi:alkylation response protein AidB-like acyl-CoA dehydrogenase
MAVASTGFLSETILETFRSRAAGYDRDNRFFQDDFDDLRTHGYLRMAVPRELGGLGFSLAEVARETRRLAMYAPATALGTNMHNYWVGLCADLWRRGD